MAYRDEERRSLPMLDRVEIASPCRESWSTMAGDERVRFCVACGRHVYNLSAMTREEASALLVGTSSERCIRLYRRPDGTVLTRDCPVGVRRRRTRRLAVAAFAGAMLAAGAIAAASEEGNDAPRPVSRHAAAPPVPAETGLRFR
jgi:hypothetical protein